MELTNILGRLSRHDEPPKPFLALELNDELVQAAVWQVVEGTTEVVSLGTPVEWTKDKDNKLESLVQAADATISAATEGLEQEPDSVVFGLPGGWTNQEGILDSQLTLIKTLCHELELKPLGYVTVIDSLLRYLKMQEGTPPTSLLVQVETSEIIVHHVNLGKLVGSQVVGKSDDASADVEEAISRLKIKGHLPSRLIVFDGMHNLEEIVQNLASYDWQTKFEFLHLPKVESLPKDVVIRSIAVAGGAEVAKAIGFTLKPEPKPPTPPPAPVPSAAPTSNQPVLTPPDKLGFHSHASPPSEPTPAQEPRRSLSLPALPKLKLPSLSLPDLDDRRLARPMLLGSLAILALLAITAAVIWFVPHATVTIFLTPKTLSETIPLTLSTTTSSIDPVESVVPAKVLETTVQGSQAAPATGTKTIGDPARGEVVIYNRTNLPKTFAKGTVISRDNLDFTLDKEVIVASASAGADYTNIPGKATVPITAQSIGTDSNLQEDTEFVIENYSTSTYVARNASALGGGSSQEINVVSQVDLDTLITSLAEKLAGEARAQLTSSDQDQGIYLLSDSLEIIQEASSPSVGEEAETVELTLKVKVLALSYRLADVVSLVDSALETAVPEGYLRTNTLPSVELGQAKESKDQIVETDAKVNIALLPALDEPTLKQALKGKSGRKVQEELQKLPGLQNARVEITPRLIPARFKFMPRNVDNIAVTILPAE